jgi:hypothetical protein
MWRRLQQPHVRWLPDALLPSSLQYPCRSSDSFRTAVEQPPRISRRIRVPTPAGGFERALGQLTPPLYAGRLQNSFRHRRLPRRRNTHARPQTPFRIDQ